MTGRSRFEQTKLFSFSIFSTCSLSFANSFFSSFLSSLVQTETQLWCGSFDGKACRHGQIVYQGNIGQEEHDMYQTSQQIGSSHIPVAATLSPQAQKIGSLNSTAYMSCSRCKCSILCLSLQTIKNVLSNFINSSWWNILCMEICLISWSMRWENEGRPIWAFCWIYGVS